jgi:tetratricopeptide (TPR) repeat protein
MDSPGENLVLMLRKLLYMASPVSIPSNYDIYYYRRYSPLLGVLTGTPDLPLAGLVLWFLVPGAIAAGKLRGPEKNALLWAGVLLAGLLPFFITARFRLPALPFVVILLAPRFMRKASPGLKLAPAGVAAGLAAALLTSNTVSEGGVNMAFHDGLAHHRMGDLERAEILFLEAYETALGRTDGVDLNGTDALFNLGVAALGRGDLLEAETYWRLALERKPDFAPAVTALQGLTR